MKYNFTLDIEGDNSLAKIIKEIEAGSLVLEFGPANGRMTKYLKEEKNCRIYAVELEEEAAADAALYTEKILVDNIENLSWLDEFSELRFDYIVFADVLEHLYAPQKVLLKAKQLLKKGGTVLVSLPNAAHNSIIINLMNNRFDYTEVGLLDNTHIRFFTYNSFQKLLLNTGLVPVLEEATYSEVGCNEIAAGYEMVPDKVSDYLRSRPYGNVYQFIFALKREEEIDDTIIRKKIKSNEVSKINEKTRPVLRCFVNKLWGKIRRML